MFHSKLVENWFHEGSLSSVLLTKGTHIPVTASAAAEEENVLFCT
jgi:hypothetical protein